MTREYDDIAVWFRDRSASELHIHGFASEADEQAFLDLFSPHMAATIHQGDECDACLRIQQAQLRHLTKQRREVRRDQADAAAERSAE